MEILTAICIISFLGIFLMFAKIMRNMAKLKHQNDRIYEDSLWSKDKPTDWAEEKDELKKLFKFKMNEHNLKFKENE